MSKRYSCHCGKRSLSLSLSLSLSFSPSPFLHYKVREILSDCALPISVLIFSFIEPGGPARPHTHTHTHTMSIPTHRPTLRCFANHNKILCVCKTDLTQILQCCQNHYPLIQTSKPDS